MKNVFQILNNMGPKWTLYRSFYALRKKTGILHRKFQPKKFDVNQKALKQGIFALNDKEDILQMLHSKNFFITEEKIDGYSKYVDNKLSVEQLKKIDENIFQLFNYYDYQFEGVNWHYNPLTKKKSKVIHWLDISDLNSDFGDIKYIWEFSRFSFTYDLVRAFAQTQEPKYIDCFWKYVNDWINNNPPEMGVNYRCSQEMSIRVMSWIFGLYSFSYHVNSKKEDIQKLLKFIYLHTAHIDKHFEFSLNSVRNNHTISEAAVMYSVGLLFPTFDNSDRWKKKGKKHLENESRWQIYRDGSYIQNSMNYHRLMIQMYTWALRLGEINEDYFSTQLKEKLYGATFFLYQHQLVETGRVPNYGANDGALVHNFSNSDYLDYRPQINTMWFLLTGNRLYKSGGYDDSLYWLFGPSYLNAPVKKVEQNTESFLDGGYFIIRDNNGIGSIRCTTYKNRPGQSDMLHFDLWINNLNLFTDAGSFQYNTEEKELNYFKGNASHNNITINNLDQMTKGSRFMWYDWTKSKVISFLEKDTFTLFEGEQYGYRPLTHRRALINLENSWIIIDDVFGKHENKKTKIELSWLFGIDNITPLNNNVWEADLNGQIYDVAMILPKDTTTKVYKGSYSPYKGWQSLHYGNKKATTQLTFTIDTLDKVRFITIVIEKGVKYYQSNNNLYIGNGIIELNNIGKKRIVKKVMGKLL